MPKVHLPIYPEGSTLINNILALKKQGACPELSAYAIDTDLMAADGILEYEQIEIHKITHTNTQIPVQAVS